jgi:hypothetical protein
LEASDEVVEARQVERAVGRGRAPPREERVDERELAVVVDVPVGRRRRDEPEDEATSKTDSGGRDVLSK